MSMATVNVRYIVDDVDAAIAWYTKHLGFSLLSSAAPAFADVTLGSLRLLLSGPTSSAGRAMPDGERPRPGGWNRIHLGGYLRGSRATASSWRRVSQRHRDRAGRLADPAEGSLRQSRRAISAGASLTFANRETSGSACGADAQVVTKSSHFLFFDPKRPNRPKSRQSRAAVLFGRLSAPR